MTGHTFITHLCECVGDCVPACPVECIHRGVTAEGDKFSYIDNNRCIDCRACEIVCPIEGAVIEWKASEDSHSSFIISAEEKAELQQRVRSISRVDVRSQARAQLWTTDCAARVVDIFEFYQPADESVRHAINAAREHALVFSLYASEVHEAFLEEREENPIAREKLKAVREYCASWQEIASKAAKGVLAEPARRAAEAASSACTGDWYAATAAANAVYALFQPMAEIKARSAEEKEKYWQHYRLIARMSPAEVKDWPLPPPGKSNPFDRVASDAGP